MAVMLTVVLTSCELPRDNAVADVSPIDGMPPTLAPLGADQGVVVPDNTGAEASIIKVQPITSQQPEVKVEVAAAGSQAEAVTDDTVIVSVTPAINNQASEAAVVDNNAPVAERGETQPVIVDATTSSTYNNQATAANPPSYNPAPNNYAGSATHLVQAGDTLFNIGQRYGVSVQAITAANGLPDDVVRIGEVLVIPIPHNNVAPPANNQYPTQPSYNAGPNNGRPTQPQFNPAQPNLGQPMPNDGYYIVAQGDSLYSIARRYGTSVEMLANMNSLSEPLVIHPGQALAVPPPGAAFLDEQPQQHPYQAYPQQPAYGQPAYGYQQPQYQQPQYQPQQPAPQYQQPQYQQPQQQPVPQYQQPQQQPQPQHPQLDYGYAPGAATHTVLAGETLVSIASRYGVHANSIAAANGLVNPNQIYVGQVLFLP